MREGNEALPMEFLMEVMDLNEKVEEAKNLKLGLTPDIAAAIEQMREDLEGRLSDALQNFHFDGSNEQKERLYLEQLKDYYLKSKYLARLQDNAGGN